MFKSLNSGQINISSFIKFITIIFVIYFYNTSLCAYAYEGIRVTANSGNKCSAEPDLSDCLIDGICDKDISASEVQKCYSSNYNTTNQSCDVGSIKFDPFGRDINWELSNDHCISYITTTAIGLAAAFMACDTMCTTAPNPINSLKEIIDKSFKPAVETSRLSQITSKAIQAGKTTADFASRATSNAVSSVSVVIDPIMVIKLGIYSGRCANILSVSDSAACCTALATCGSAYATAIGILGAIFGISESAFNSTRICGDGTRVWKEISDNSGKNVWTKDNNDYFKCLKYYYEGDSSGVTGSSITLPTSSSMNRPTQRFKDFVSKKMSGQTICSSTTNGSDKTKTDIHYREYLYGGIEYTDNGDGACDNPKDSDGKTEWNEELGYSGGKQRYYFRGAPEEPQFACSRFLALGIQNTQGYEAYKCCKNRAKNTICMERPNSDTYLFCSAGGSRCSFKATPVDTLVTYEVFESFEDPRYLCARTYSLCPYNHPIGGGTEEFDKDYKTNITSNFCQIRRHCIKKPPTSDTPRTSISDSFFSDACSNRKGDSQFIHSFNDIKSPIPLRSRNFSAPIVQCLKESLENNFFQIAGRDICPNLNDIVVNGKCRSYDNNVSEIMIKKGQKLGNTIFAKIQGSFKTFIKLALILSVTMLGYQILLATPEDFINKKTIMLFLVKFSLVSYFALSTEWHPIFLDKLLKISDDLSHITFFPKTINDGCTFPKFNGENFTRLKSGDSSYGLKEFKADPKTQEKFYSDGKSYLRIWDTLDCKLTRALGYGVDVNSDNFSKMIFSGFLTGPLGITFAFASLAYGFMLISIILRSIHITIMSLTGVILLIFVSPLTITCVMFERTKGIFENWYKQLLGFILQPMILFAYLGVLLTIFDHVFIGDAVFKAPTVATSGTNSGTTSGTQIETQLTEIDCSDQANGKKPSQTSIYCIFNMGKFKNYSGLELFDLAIPILKDLNKEKINSVIKAAIILFVFYQFFDKITTLAKKLVGGAELKPESMPEIQKKLQKFAKGVQKRALNASTRFATKDSKKIVRSLAGRGGDDASNSGSMKLNSSSGGATSDSASSSSGGGSSGGGGGSSGSTVV